MNPTQESTRPSLKPVKSGLNIWVIVSIILAIALIGVLLNGWRQKGQAKGAAGGDKAVVLSADEAANSIVSFINESYPQIGAVTLKGVKERNGIYEITFTMMSEGKPTDQIVFTTPDAKIFIPQVIDVDAMKAQIEALKQQQQAATTGADNTAPAEEPAPEEVPAE